MKVKKYCKNCGKEIFVWPCLEKFGRGKYCNKKCSREHYKNNHPHKGKIGEEAPNYKGGYILSSGSGNIKYREIRINKKKKLEHRYLMENIIGRKLSQNEVVHHVDRDGLNNNIKNLRLMTLSEHTKYHLMHKI